MSSVKSAVFLFKEGFNCSQAVLASRAEEFGLDSQTALKLTAGLGGGIGSMGGICGALTGAILVLGLKYGTANPADKNGRHSLYQRVKDLTEQFKTQAGSICCRDLLGFDLGTPEGQITSKKIGAFDHCPEFVRLADELVDEALKK